MPEVLHWPAKMTTPSKRRSVVGHAQLSVEEQALNMIAKEAETREATSNAVLAEARKIRTNELERIRKEQGDDGEESLETQDVPEPSKPKDIKEIKSTNNAIANEIVHSKSIEELPTDLAQWKLKFDELELKYKKVMMGNAQLDNEKHANQYQLELLKDQVGDLEEDQIELKRQLQHVSQELTLKSKALEENTTKQQHLEKELQERNDLIKANGLMVVSVADQDADKANEGNQKKSVNFSSTLLSFDCLQILSQFEGGSLGEKLQNFFDDKQRLIEENKRIQHELEMERSRFALAQKYPIANEPSSPVLSSAVPDGIVLDAETQKNVTETKLKLRKAEQEITTLQGAVTRLESQVNRYKLSSEAGDKAVEELKLEKRKLQKEMREVQVHVEDLEAKNHHLNKRLEKTKTAKT